MINLKKVWGKIKKKPRLKGVISPEEFNSAVFGEFKLTVPKGGIDKDLKNYVRKK